MADRDSLKDLKIKLNDDVTFEATFKVGDTFDSLLSMVADVSKYQKYIDLAKDKPIYIKSSVVYNGGNSFNIQTQELSVGRISVPIDRVNSEMTSVRAEINNVLSSMPGLTIENFSFDSTGVKFKGTIQESINIKNN